MKMKILRAVTPSIGADPEFFITSIDGKKIIESNKVLPKNGISFSSSQYSSASRCTIDGVQAEINPKPFTCRQGAGKEYKFIFKKLVNTLSEKKVTMCLESMIHFSQEELDNLSDDSKKFGCEPSLNYYTGKESKITVNPNVYGFRSAGGHIHLGGLSSLFINKEHKLIIKILDLILGNTCVMLDRDSNQVERRTVYGRAGEYRLPSHGIEYRTLSNFWIKNYQLMAMVYGLARLGITIAYNIYSDELKPLSGKSCFRELLRASNKKDVQEAINNNDFDLAKKNWDKIKHILVSMIPSTNLSRYPINSEYLDVFEHFIDKGLYYWFKDDLLTHWTKKLKTISGVGWELFLKNVVRKDIAYNGKIRWSITSCGFRVVNT